ncbi:MAG: hypothetical protein KC476_05575 [Cyanobacteria bacterium HKST-UBA06]|nr:hypothetical protein [Cyanobacteria bacterium HKST-UBA06]
MKITGLVNRLNRLVLNRLVPATVMGVVSGCMLLGPVWPLCAYAFRVDPSLEHSVDNSPSSGTTISKRCINEPGGVSPNNLHGSWGEDNEYNAEEDCITPIYSLQVPEPPPTTVVQPVAQTDDGTPVFKGTVEKSFKADVEFDTGHTLPKGETLILTMLDFLATGYNMAGDEFNAVIKEPIERNGKILIPEGSLVQGHLEGAGEQADSNRYKNQIVMVFDHILLPNGQKIPLDGTTKTQRTSLVKEVAQRVGGGVGGSVKGAVKGVLVGLQFGGIEGAVASEGWTLAIGAGIGAVAGLGKGLARTNDQIVVRAGDKMKIKLESPLDLPTYEPVDQKTLEITATGLDIEITNLQIAMDPFQVDHQIKLTLDIDNQTDYDFGLYDFELVDTFGTVYRISPFSHNQISFETVDAHKQFKGDFLFPIQNPQLSHFLVVYKPYTRDVLARYSLHEAYKSLTKSSGSSGKGKTKSSRQPSPRVKSS